MLKFDVAMKCPKCFVGIFKPRHYTETEGKPEHLRVVCQQCEYHAEMECADKTEIVEVAPVTDAVPEPKRRGRPRRGEV